jgi:acyl-CoA thioester hydrolase
MNTSELTYRIDQKVRWKELDALNHVNNAQYFSYFEEVRIEYMRRLGYGAVDSHSEFGPILANISCDFKSPLTYPDTLSIGCGISRIGNSSLVLDYDIFSSHQNKLVATGTSVVVMVNYKSGKAIPIPEDVRKTILEINPNVA